MSIKESVRGQRNFPYFLPINKMLFQHQAQSRKQNKAQLKPMVRVPFRRSTSRGFVLIPWTNQKESELQDPRMVWIARHLRDQLIPTR